MCGRRLFALGCLWLALQSACLSAEVVYQISKQELLTLVNDCKVLKQELQNSKLELLQAQQKMQDLLRSSEKLQKSLEMSAQELTMLSEELKGLKQSFDEYKIAVALKLRQAESEKVWFGVGGLAIGAVVAFLITGIVGAAK